MKIFLAMMAHVLIGAVLNGLAKGLRRESRASEPKDIILWVMWPLVLAQGMGQAIAEEWRTPN